MVSYAVDFSNPINIIIFLLLVFFSCLSWAIIFSKISDLYRLRKQLRYQKDLLDYCKKTDWKQWHKKIVSQRKTIFFTKLYNKVQESINSNMPYDDHARYNLHKYLELFLNEEEENRIQGLSWLATIANISPYIGLLGTLGGVIQTFALMNGQTITITQLTPGLIESLQATAMGLLVAIPANIAYNKFTASYRSSLNQLATQGQYLLLHVDAFIRTITHESEYA